MSERVISPLSYSIVLLLLLLLTLLTLGISFTPLPGLGHIVVGLVIAAVKASLVVLFFMHALNSPRITWIVIAVAVTWVTVLLSLTLSDYFSRGMIPYLPGH